jgi:dihydroorotate dehydrogenase
MSLATFLSRIDHTLRPLLGSLKPRIFTHLYSATRPWFSAIAANDAIQPIIVPDTFKVCVRNLTFRSPIGNAAGMYKHAEGYERAYAQGAGFYLAGTTTSLPRKGNIKNRIALPFVPYPKSHAASNWLGLPNKGHIETAKHIATFSHYPEFPIGASVSMDPGMNISQGLQGLIEGIKAYQDAGCDFIELNESCPNVSGHSTDHKMIDDSLIARLDAIADTLDLATYPVIVKFSNDTDPALIKPLMSILVERKFAGINLGNTSTAYQKYASQIHDDDKKHYEYFTKEYGGGLSGAIMRESSLQLCSIAHEYLREHSIKDCIVIATGGIETSDDIREAMNTGAHLTQWYTGYFERFGVDGNKVYSNLYQQLDA